MAAGVLHDVSFAYQLFWNAKRQVAGVRLHIRPHSASAFEAEHLLSTLSAAWPSTAPPLLLASSDAPLLSALLKHLPAHLAQLELSQAMLERPDIAEQLASAQRRGLQLVWRGEPGERLQPIQTAYFARQIHYLSPEEALTGLRAGLQQRKTTAQTETRPIFSPVLANQFYAGVASRALLEHCLDQQNVSALLGWPAEDVLHGYRLGNLYPAHDNINRLLRAIEADTSMDDIERCLGLDPLLSFLYLRFANSASLGLQHDIASLRQGLMVLGLGRTRSWLIEQRLHNTHDLNLRPIHSSMVLRAQLMAQMLHTGEELALKRELYLCGLLSQIDLLVSDSLAHALKSIPLPERIKNAILGLGGPYQAFLEMACAMESEQASLAHTVCDRYELDQEAINQALLNTLAKQ
jgi:hypothetical protein